MAGTGSGKPTAEEVLAGVRWGALGSAVRGRLAGWGKAYMGNCLYASLFGAAAVQKALTGTGANVLIQAGTAMWRRLPAEVAEARGERESECFSYEFDPQHPLSAAGMAAGGMPEYHAWVVVKVPCTGRGPAAYRVVDFASHNVPGVCRGQQRNAVHVIEGKGEPEIRFGGSQDWLMPEPPNPDVIDPAEFERRLPCGGIERVYYRVDPVATVGVVAVATNALYGREAGLPDVLKRHHDDLWAVLGERPPADSWMATPGLTPLSCFVVAHDYVRRHPERFKGERADGK